MSTPNESRAERFERRIELPVIVAALLIVPTIAIEESPLSHHWRWLAMGLDWLAWMTFLAEVAIMLAVVPDRRAWIRDHPVDLAVVILTSPLLPLALQSTRLLRLLRLTRLIRTRSFIRQALSLEGLRYFALLVCFTVVGGGALFSSVEHQQHLSVWDGIWWAFSTITTVGYGDIVPHTLLGRLLAMVIMAIGVSFVALITAAASQRVISAESRQIGQAVNGREDEIIERLDEISTRLAALERKTLV